MSKPIFIVRFPNVADVEHLEFAAKSMVNQGMYEHYHILVLKDQFADGDIKFECFNAPHTEIEFNELREKVLASIKSK